MASSKSLRSSRASAFRQQGGRCIYCEFPIWLKHPKKFAGRHGLPPEMLRHAKCTAEHLKERQHGGGSNIRNIAAACAWCNSHRHAGRPTAAPSPVEYKEEVAMLVAAGLHPMAALQPA